MVELTLEESELVFDEIGAEQEEDNWAEKWIPETGESITGFYKGTTPATSKDGRKLTFHLITEFTTKEEYSILGSTVLDAKLDKIDIDDIVKITYDGMKPNKNNTAQYKMYTVHKARL